MRKMSSLKVNEKAIVSGFASEDKAYCKRLMIMGLTKGTKFSVTRVAPLGDPFEILVKDYSLSLRKGEAESILVEKI